MIGRPATCYCGDCRKCRRRETARLAYQAKPVEERRAWVARRDAELTRERERARAKAPARKRYIASNTKRWRKANPEKARAQRKVAYEVGKGKGRLVKKPCEVCGADKVHAHHDDYSKPLEVRWLCALHHAAERRTF